MTANGLTCKRFIYINCATMNIQIIIIFLTFSRETVSLKMTECNTLLGYNYQTTVVCGGCETIGNVESFCLTCDANLCDSCKAHLIHRKHTVLPMTHSTVVATRMSMKLPCKQHPGENYVTYCNTCQEPCCPKCIPSSHGTHVFSELDMAARDTRGQLTRI